MPEAGRPRGCLREALPSRGSPSMCPQPAGPGVGMNFGVVFAFMLSLPLARMEVSFRRGQRAVLPSCQPRAGREPRRLRPAGAAGAARGEARSPGQPSPGARSRPRSAGRAAAGPGRANGGQRPPPPARRAAPAGEGTPLELAPLWSWHLSGAGTSPERAAL